MPAPVAIELQGQLAITTKTVTLASRPLWAMIARAGELRYRWEQTRDEEDRVAMRAAWDIHITCTGAELFGQRPKPGDWERCTPTVLCQETGDDDNHLAYRGACLGCGWVSPAVHLLWHEGENGAAEDANDHAHPGWRALPVVGPLPHGDGGAAHERALASWRSRWEPLLPEGWLEGGGPVRTEREPNAGRHVPGRAPGGGYDMAGRGDEPEALGGQLALFA